MSLLVFVWFGLPAWVYCDWGLQPTEKLLTQYVMPVGLVWNLLILGAAIASLRGQDTLTMLLIASMLTITLVGNSTLGALSTNRLEGRFADSSPDDFQKPFRAIIMLGGCARRLPSGRVEVNGEGQRIVAAAEFWHAGKTEWIVTTGRRPQVDPEDASVISLEVLESLGVPRNRILRIPARNTYEEIRSIRELLDNPPANFAETQGQIGLVTSAFHMPRAMRLAGVAGLDLVPLPSGHRGSFKDWSPVSLVPNSQAIDGNSIVFKEYFAGLVGR